MQINRLRVRRAELDITQGRAAKAAGMGRYRFWQIENGDGPEATDDEIKNICKALKCKRADLFPEVAEATR
jgi:transcriptional regulator with XRE-family HTH domain